MTPAVPPPAIDLIGYAAAACTTASWIPQVVRTWRSRSAGDLSPAMLAAFSTGVLLWLVFGLALGSGPIILANALTLALNLLLVVLRIRYGGRGPART